MVQIIFEHQDGYAIAHFSPSALAQLKSAIVWQKTAPADIKLDSLNLEVGELYLTEEMLPDPIRTKLDRKPFGEHYVIEMEDAITFEEEEFTRCNCFKIEVDESDAIWIFYASQWSYEEFRSRMIPLSKIFQEEAQ